jgi:ABC-2 type transport system permease protein
MTRRQLVQHEFGYERRSAMRDPQALFFAIGLPLLYVVIFVSLFGNERMKFIYDGQPGPLKAHTIMLAGFIAIAVISATFFNLCVKLVQERESGILKRFRGTPLPTWAFVAGHVGTSILLGMAVAAALLVFGRVVYGIPVPPAGLPALLLALVVSSAAFSCLGFAFTMAVRRASAAVPLVTGITLALYFLSGNFFLVEHEPVVLRVVGAAFPVKHLNSALLTPLNPNAGGLRIEWVDLLVIAAWGLVGLLVAVRYFRWAPRGEGKPRTARMHGSSTASA